MKRIIFSLMCVGMALCLLAGTPRLTRSQLKRTPLTKDQTIKLSVTPGKEKPLTLKQVLKERQLTMDDNRLNGNRSGVSLNTILPGQYIASLVGYDFDWDEENGVAVVNDSSHALMGKQCSIKVATSDQEIQISDFFGSYNIPLYLDSDTWKLKAGVRLDGFTVSTGDSVITWNLYAMPLSWVTGESDDYDDIRIDGNGKSHALEFIDDFAFLVEKKTSDPYDNVKVSWGISPIFTDLVLYWPNATHSYFSLYSSLDLSQLTYLNTPVLYGEDDASTTDFNPRPIDPRHGSGTGSSNVKNPGNAKPVPNPRPFTPNLGCPHPQFIGSSPQEENNSTEDRGMPLSSSSKVYAYMLDDTTLMVYNLFGKDYCWNYLNVYPDHHVSFPAQPIDALNGNILYNCEELDVDSDTLRWGNQGYYSNNAIIWDDTYLCKEDGQALGFGGHKSCYKSNVINFDDFNFFNVDSLAVGPEDSTVGNVTVNPGKATAQVTWEDTTASAWNLRYRVSIDPSDYPIDCDFSFNDYYDDLAGWTHDDADGDGHCWVLRYSGSDQNDLCLASYSWLLESEEGLDPDNWLISPDVRLQGELRFTIWGMLYYYTDRLMVYAEVDGNLYPLTTEDLETTPEPTTYTFDLNDFDGEIGNIIFRHYNSNDRTVVYMDDIFIGNPVDGWVYSYNIGTTSFTIDGLVPETTYEVEIQAADESLSQSAWTQPVEFMTLPNIYMVGDVNCDGFVNIQDITRLIRAVLTGEFDDCETFSSENADVNLDGGWSVADVTLLISRVLSGNTE